VVVDEIAKVGALVGLDAPHRFAHARLKAA
jgi:hypothetical protein